MAIHNSLSRTHREIGFALTPERAKTSPGF